MENLKKRIEAIKEDQKSWVVTSFTNAEAFDLGCYIYQKALREGKPVAVSVTRNRQRLFYAAAEGTTTENDHYIMRKENTAYFFQKSTFEIGLYMKLRNDNIWDKFGLPRGEYVQSGGCIPIHAEGFGMIGTASVSGMSQEDDHLFITEAFAEWNAKKEK